MPTLTGLPETSTLHVEQQIDIDAPIATVWKTMLAQIGPENARPDGVSMDMVLEPFPGGRWYRDLGNDAGHLWGHVQVIKPPTLLEIVGPLFMSYPAASHVQWRLTERGKGTRLTLRHAAFGMIPQEHKEGVQHGWRYQIEQIKKCAES